MANFGEGPARFVPVNRQEFENELATIAGKHMGDLQGNPSAWVIHALREAYQAGFALGFDVANQVAAKRAQQGTSVLRVGTDPQGRGTVERKNAQLDRLYPPKGDDIIDV